MSTTEAAVLAHAILVDSEDEHPADLYTLNVREARTLAHAVACVEALAEELEEEGRRVIRDPHRIPRVAGWTSGVASASTRLRAALNGETA